MNREKSIYFKGIAMFLMIINHIFPLHELIYSENEYIGLSLGSFMLEDVIGGYAKICVALFAFLTGTGIAYFARTESIKNLIKKTIHKVNKIYLVYWFVLIVLYIPSGILIRKENFSINYIVKNFLCIENSWNMPAWYILTYAEILFALSLVVYMGNKKFPKYKRYMLCLIAAGINIFFGGGYPEFTDYFTVATIGYLSTECNIFEIYCTLMKKKKHIFIMLSNGALLMTSFLGRLLVKEIFGVTLDGVYCIALILPVYYILGNMKNNAITQKINNVVMLFGKKSTFIWLTHGIVFYTNQKVQNIIYWPKISALVFINAVIWFLILGITIEALYKYMSKKIEMLV